MAAVDKTLEEIRTILDKYPSEVHRKNKGGQTPLHMAARKEYAELLIERGAEIDAKDDNGQTPLHTAARWAYDEVVSVLLAHGAEVNAKDKNGYTPLLLAHAAVNTAHDEQKRDQTLKLLKEKGGIVDEEVLRKVLEDNIKNAEQQDSR